MVYNWLNYIQPILYPSTCLLCGAGGSTGMDLCPGCLADLPRNRHACTACALPLPDSAPDGSLCGACQRKAPVFDRCLAPFRYEGVLPHLVTGLKFHGRMNYARLLGDLLSEILDISPAVFPEVIIPVPLHPSRLRERGFNQALEIARSIERNFGVELDTDSVIRHAATTAQSGLDARQRRRNLRGAFVVNEALPFRHVALFDDVVTTGSTVTELAKVLKRSGVKRVDVWAVARTP